MDGIVLVTDNVDLVFGDYNDWLVLIDVAGVDHLRLLSLGKGSGKYILLM